MQDIKYCSTFTWEQIAFWNTKIRLLLVSRTSVLSLPKGSCWRSLGYRQGIELYLALILIVSPLLTNVSDGETQIREKNDIMEQNW